MRLTVNDTAASASDDVQITVNAPTGSVELLSNPSFTMDGAGWSLYTYTNTGANTIGSGRTTTAGEYDTSPAGYKVVCTNNGVNSSDIQFYSTVGFSIRTGASYQLTFRAKAAAAYVVPAIQLMKMGSPWSSYYSESTGRTPQITTNWANYTVTYKANATTNDARTTF